MIEESNKINNFCLYSDDKNHRYLLSRIWDEKKSIPLFVSKYSGAEMESQTPARCCL